MNSYTLSRTLSGALIILMSLELNAQININLKAFLEGPFNGSTMNTALNTQNLIPLNQPYNGSPWNYNGTEQVVSIPNTAIVDWVLVELRETAGDATTASPGTRVAMQAGFILNNGTITSVDGDSPLQFNIVVTQNLFAIVHHRNHLAIMSSYGITLNAGVNWDFTTDVGEVYGGLLGHKELVPGIWGMIAGDGNASSQVSGADVFTVWSPPAGSHGYYQADFNMDGEVNNSDKDDYWTVNLGTNSQVQLPWSCNMPFTDGRDSQVYSTIQIGSQCWMAQNLNIGTRVDSIVSLSDNGVQEKYCYHDNVNNCNEYGALYSWNELMQYTTIEGSQGMCPVGWHVPSGNEWTALIDFLGGVAVAGDKMKESGTLHWDGPNTATNVSGFTGLGSGWGDFYWDNSFWDMKSNTFFWSSTQFDIASSHDVYLGTDMGFGNVFSGYHWKDYRYSVRCLKDSPPPVWGCGDTLVDSRDNKKYTTVQIGSQCWMAENLNVGTIVPGTTEMTNNGVIEKVCYNNNPVNCDTYGGLYEWKEMMEYTTIPGGQGICPVGWHLPQDPEWCTLSTFLDPTVNCNGLGWLGTDAGGNMKESGYAHWQSPNTGATNTSGFAALPGGGLYNLADFYLLNTNGLFWSSTAYDTDNKWYWYLSNDNAAIFRGTNPFYEGFSVRCVKDTPPAWGCGDTLVDTRDNQKYTTVQIGTQCWMAENLNIGTMIPGVNNMYDNGVIEKYCYNNYTPDCDNWGALYSWDEMMQYVSTPGVQGICPADWHIPSDAEWTALTDFLGGADVAGGKMKDLTHWFSPNTGATNESGLTALGSGFRNYAGGSFSARGSETQFWSSSEGYVGVAWYRYLFYNISYAGRDVAPKNYGYSVRCLWY